jgi:PAS domain-containing protein
LSGSSNTQFRVTLGDDETSRLEDFAAATNGWFWETDSEHHFTYMSASVEDVTGVPREWHYGKTREELGSPDSVFSRAKLRKHRKRNQAAFVGDDIIQGMLPWPAHRLKRDKAFQVQSVTYTKASRRTEE